MKKNVLKWKNEKNKKIGTARCRWKKRLFEVDFLLLLQTFCTQNWKQTIFSDSKQSHITCLSLISKIQVITGIYLSNKRHLFHIFSQIVQKITDFFKKNPRVCPCFRDEITTKCLISLIYVQQLKSRWLQTVIYRLTDIFWTNFHENSQKSPKLSIFGKFLPKWVYFFQKSSSKSVLFYLIVSNFWTRGDCWHLLIDYKTFLHLKIYFFFEKWPFFENNLWTETIFSKKIHYKVSYITKLYLIFELSVISDIHLLIDKHFLHKNYQKFQKK